MRSTLTCNPVIRAFFIANHPLDSIERSELPIVEKQIREIQSKIFWC